MKGILETVVIFLVGDAQAERMVPPSGHTVRLTIFAAAAMALLACFAMAFSLATARLAQNWTDDLSRSMTVRISPLSNDVATVTAKALVVLRTTPGVGTYRVIDPQEQGELLAPWFGENLDVSQLTVPTLIELVEGPQGLNTENLRLRLAAEVPDAVFEDHARWQRPLVNAAWRLRILGGFVVALIFVTVWAVVTLAAQSALTANAQVISVMRLIGARDNYITQAFVRRFTFRSFWGALIGFVLSVLALIFLPTNDEVVGVLANLAPKGAQWVWLAAVPFVIAILAFFATRGAAKHVLRTLS